MFTEVHPDGITADDRAAPASTPGDVRVADVVAHAGRTYARQTANAQTHEQRYAGHIMPQVGFVMERLVDFLFKDEVGCMWYVMDAQRYPELHRVTLARGDAIGVSGTPVFVVRPVHKRVDEFRVSFPLPGDVVNEKWEAPFVFMGSNGRVTTALLRARTR